ncbi:UNVERIFIED_CONTAM: hypothetical protein Sindi_2328600 [Sesamum indicum]
MGDRLSFSLTLRHFHFAAAYRFALVGKFSHGAPQYRNLHRLVAGLGIRGAFTVSMINAKHVLISMSNETDFSRLWLEEFGTYKDIRCGYSNGPRTFTPAQESSIVPIWVSFPELPAHLFHKDALYAVASMIGTPLQIDDFTFNQSKLSKARVCIEIDLLTPLIQEFDIQINGNNPKPAPRRRNEERKEPTAATNGKGKEKRGKEATNTPAKQALDGKAEKSSKRTERENLLEISNRPVPLTKLLMNFPHRMENYYDSETELIEEKEEESAHMDSDHSNEDKDPCRPASAVFVNGRLCDERKAHTFRIQ